MAAGSTSALATWTGRNVQRTDQQDFRRSRDRAPASARHADAEGQPHASQAGHAGRAHEAVEIGRASCRERVTVRVDLRGSHIINKTTYNDIKSQETNQKTH